MDLKEFYKEVGGEYENVMLRLSNPDMVKRFVRKFPDDPSYADLKLAWEENDVETAFRAAHTMKGIAANLGLDSLAETASNLTEQLRNATELPQECYVKAVDIAYQMTVEKIALIEG